VRALFGEAGLERLIGAREVASEAACRSQVDAGLPLAGQVAALARARDAEGYMAESEAQPDGSVLLVENHCPVCAAARSCQQLCRSELELFGRVLGPNVSVVRIEHQLAGARRCAYRVSASPAASD
jgi:predicted ArsR family transcriptional regulator